MMSNKYFSKVYLSTITGSLALSCSIFFAGGAFANDAAQLLKGFFSGNNNARFAGNPAQAQTVSNLANQRVLIESRIANALYSGQITPAQAESFRAQLNSNVNLQNQYLADGVFEFGEAQIVLDALNSLDASLTASLAATPSMPGFNNGPGRYRQQRWTDRVSAAQIDNRFRQLSRDIERGRVEGRLPQREYNALQSELNKISMERARLQNSDGYLSRNEERLISDRINRLQSRFVAELSDGRNSSSRRWY